MDHRGLAKLLTPIKRGLQMVVARALVTAVGQGRAQTVQVALLAGEAKDGVEHAEPYGFTAHPHAGATAVVVFVGGDRSHGIAAVVSDPRYRPADLVAGEVCVYTDQGDEIRIKRGGELVIKAATKVRIETPLLEVTGEVRDRCDAGGRTMAEMRQTYDGHTHGGVQPGSGSTAAPNQGM
ncbi:phage baseplate assembly protein V [Azospirillum argentinense]|uniref:phage baseplate assembly protein V n=1 Tax=Azospirillum argentinense TaxID=2970906 RepID=UPI00190A1D80|nr:phage baseplate assembly protein V [Azospirillum argentinense]